MSKFKVGDRVRVRENLKGGNRYDGLLFNTDMEQYKGKTCVVRVVDKMEDTYLIDACGWRFNDKMLVPAEFTKSDLKNGMIAEYRDGIRRLVIGENLLGNDGYGELTNYDDNLMNYYYSDLDIAKVFDVPTGVRYLTTLLDEPDDKLVLLWERDETEEMTLAEIEKKLGHKVKIVNQKEEV